MNAGKGNEEIVRLGCEMHATTHGVKHFQSDIYSDSALENKCAVGFVCVCVLCFRCLSVRVYVCVCARPSIPVIPHLGFCIRGHGRMVILNLSIGNPR